MKKKELVAKVSARSKVSGIAVNRVIKSLVKTIAESVHAGEKVTLSGLGTFRMKTRKPKPARNLQTGETVHLPEGKKVSFKPSLSFKRLLKQPPPSLPA
ncbi:MAG: hypothetical protein A2902_05860 [Elusimicrobia bacterium RIFCSPLOWO2_01_FULL_64_13]|nr:MAG: hypothetical protein A2636_04425 [Elusimicrobia bacterium RIFCSPHIGHO2_01_FULL_64_10]OGR94273.1 MAG: hypothetical protein A2902_05860 [Elusimicrobia bacterium RIFCSPLOWO2_01_FULL_64_13]